MTGDTRYTWEKEGCIGLPGSAFSNEYADIITGWIAGFDGADCTCWADVSESELYLCIEGDTIDPVALNAVVENIEWSNIIVDTFCENGNVVMMIELDPRIHAGLLPHLDLDDSVEDEDVF